MEQNPAALAQQLLITLAIILAAGTLVGKVANWLNIPDVVFFLLTGLMIGSSGLGLVNIPVNSVFNQGVLILGASLLLFHGGTGVSFRVLRDVWLTLFLLSTLAVIVMTMIVGYAAHLIFGISLMYALLLAAIIAPTDPATLVPIFLSVGVKERLSQTVISESAFNDATGAIATFTILGILTTGQYSAFASLEKFLVMAGGGIFVGAVYGLLVGYLISIKSRHVFSEYAQVLTLPLIIAAYMTAEHFGASGFMAVFIAGLVIGNLEECAWTMPEKHHGEMHAFIANMSLLVRMIIFILLGTQVNLNVVAQYLLPASAVVAVFIFIARPLAVLLCVLPDRAAKWERNEILFMFWTRETGVIPAALVGIITGMGIEHGDIISSVTFLAILATLILQATSTPWLAQKLNLLVLPKDG
ncbi:MAG TPA: sodium:proton antiporter [Patescibacteria group bacterium]|nr:sodium:proton antiporter [Patescibacteria group bacterium]